MTTSLNWPLIIREIRRKKFTPILSDRAFSQYLPGYETLVNDWAKAIKYPLGTSFNVTRLAQFLSVKYGDVAKSEYLYFVKERVLENANHKETINIEESDLDDLPLTEIAERLGVPNFTPEHENPLYVLARLPIPIYITTSYHTFMEEELYAAGKNPRTEICYWSSDLKPVSTELRVQEYQSYLRGILATYFTIEDLKDLCAALNFSHEDLPAQTRSAMAREIVTYLEQRDRLPELATYIKQERPRLSLQAPANIEAESDLDSGTIVNIPSVFHKESGYIPDEDNPLVYHLHGLETYPSSLVLTENDYLDFLVQIAKDKNSLIPDPVKTALTMSSLLLLGYDLQDWDFRVLFKGLITSRMRQRGGVNICIQLKPTQGQIDQAQDFLQEYFKQAKFSIYWGNSQEFAHELWQEWPDKTGEA
ncbi:MAG: SIR2 family protein [Ardenticatenaceae bacterium]|nr:SIR2 family protein [Anaerolineales bacterium]MCB8920095.1 SIR2 family protein [Ardenticatenaceae bacterium]